MASLTSAVSIFPNGRVKAMSEFVPDTRSAQVIRTAPYALEVTGKDIGEIEAARDDLRSGTPINIAFLGNEDHAQRINAARAIRSFGFEPVPIISSRRLRSAQDLETLMQGLIAAAAPQRFIFVGGDPATPAGPFQDSIALLKAGVIERHAIRHAGIVGYPEGHPKIRNDALLRALKWKHDFLRQAGCTVEITAQYGFDAEAVLRWIKLLRDEGVQAPIRVGVPGPADVGKLLRFARQFGVTTSAAIVRRYGLSLTNLLMRVGPDRYWNHITAHLAREDLGDVLFHLYPFGGIRDGVRWMNQHTPAAAC